MGCKVDDDLCDPEDENGSFDYVLSGTDDDNDVEDDDDYTDDDYEGKRGVCAYEWLVCEVF